MLRRIGSAAAVTIAAAAGLSLAGAAAAGPAAAGELAHTSIAGGWEGSFTCSQGLTGLDLQISPPGSGGALTATFSFYPLTANPTVPVGIFTMTGTDYSASRIVLQPGHWVLQPPGYVEDSLTGKLTGDRFHGTVTSGTGGAPGCTTFSVRKLSGRHTRRAVIGTWKGSYLGCSQGPTGLRLAVKPKGKTGRAIRAVFSFHALKTNPGVPSGSFAMTGYYFPGGVVLDQQHWIKNPGGYNMVNLVGKAPGRKKWTGVIVGCSTFSVKR